MNRNPHMYTTKQGVVFELRPISALLIRQLQNDRFGMPQPPVVESKVGPQKRIVKEANPNDPDYTAALAAWEENKNERLIIYIMTRSICDQPTSADTERLREFLPGGTEAQIKYAWVLEHLLDDNELADLAEIIMGQMVPTQKGISVAEERFSGDGEQPTASEVSATAESGEDSDGS